MPGLSGAFACLTTAQEDTHTWPTRVLERISATSVLSWKDLAVRGRYGRPDTPEGLTR